MPKRLPWGHKSRRCCFCGLVGPRTMTGRGYAHKRCIDAEVKAGTLKRLAAPEYAFAMGSMNAVEYLSAIGAGPTELEGPIEGVHFDTKSTIEGANPGRREPDVDPLDRVAAHAFSEFIKRAGAPPKMLPPVVKS